MVGTSYLGGTVGWQAQNLTVYKLESTRQALATVEEALARGIHGLRGLFQKGIGEDPSAFDREIANLVSVNTLPIPACILGATAAQTSASLAAKAVSGVMQRDG